MACQTFFLDYYYDFCVRTIYIWYLINHTDQLSLAIPPGKQNEYQRNGHTKRCI